MKTKSLTIMGAIAVVLTGAAVFVSQHKEFAPPQMGQRLFPDLLAAINEVSELHVSAQRGAVTILRDGDLWSVKEKHRYPADMGKLREALIGLAGLQILEAKTAKPERYEKLGVRDVDAEGSLSTGVMLKDLAGHVLAEVIVGHERPARGATGHKEVFVRKPGNPQTWLATGNFPVGNSPDEWLDKDFLHIETKRVKRVSVTHPDRTRLIVEKEKPDDLDYHVVGLSEGQEIQSQFTVNNIVSTVTSLSFDDVRPKGDVSFDETAAVVATFETFDGLEGTVNLLQRDEQHYVTVSAAFKAGLIWKPEPEEDSENRPDGQETPEQENEEAAAPEPPVTKPEAAVKAEIEALTQTVAAWVYVIPQFRAETILTKPADLLKQPG